MFKVKFMGPDTIREEIREEMWEEARDEIWAEAREEIQEKVWEEAREEIRAEGREEGHIEERVKNARSMLAKGLSDELVQEITGLSNEDIDKLRD